VYEVNIVGHTDSQRISDATARRHPTNMHLSCHRAISVRSVLASMGVPAGRMEAAGWGEFRPMVANTSSGNTPQNRRVEIYLSLPKGGESASAMNTDFSASPVNSATPERDRTLDPPAGHHQVSPGSPVDPPRGAFPAPRCFLNQWQIRPDPAAAVDPLQAGPVRVLRKLAATGLVIRQNLVVIDPDAGLKSRDVAMNPHCRLTLVALAALVTLAGCASSDTSTRPRPGTAASGAAPITRRGGAGRVRPGKPRARHHRAGLHRLCLHRDAGRAPGA
jgi:hypothetical protein